jgi:transposase
MSDRSGVSRGDRNRNARLARLRAAVPLCNAIAGIDLADARQMVVVTDHESRVLARRAFQRRAWQLGAALDWAATRPGQRDSPGSRSQWSRPGTGGGWWVSWLLTGGCRSCACSRC